MPNQETKRQHYVPRTYLQHFSIGRSEKYFINSLLKKDFPTGKIQENDIDNICVKKKIYTLPSDNPEERMLIENFYQNYSENEYNKFYDFLIDPQKTLLTDDERKYIISFVVMMHFRNFKPINEFYIYENTLLEKAYSLCRQNNNSLIKIREHKISIEDKSLEQIQNERKKAIKPHLVITQIKEAFKLIEYRVKNDFIFVTKLMEDDCEYITSDNPVCIHNTCEERFKPCDAQSILALPLDNKHYLFLMPNTDKIDKNTIGKFNVTGESCKEAEMCLNHQQFLNAERFILGTEKGLLSYISTMKSFESILDNNKIEE